MTQKIDIGDYVNFNLDKNEMATSLNNLNNGNYTERGSHMMDNLMEEIENMPQTQPLILGNKSDGMQQPMMQQPMMQQSMMQQPMMQQQQQPIIQQPVYYKENDSEKKKVLKDLDITESEKIIVEPKDLNLEVNNEPEQFSEKVVKKKSLLSNIKETILVVLLYILIGNDYVNLYVTNYIPYFNESPLILFMIKVILIGLLFHTIRWFIK